MKPPYQFIEMTGKEFGRLTVVCRDGLLNGKPAWKCRCACGGEATIQGKSLRSGLTLSCGCLQKESVIKRNLIHGLTDHPLSEIWNGMVKRCTNPKCKAWKYYGGRGISVCEHWRTFINFYNDMVPSWSPGLEIDRENVNGNYEPSNCRWVTRKVQANNKRSNKTITFNGETLTYSEWDDKLGRHPNTTGERVRRGMTPEMAITEPYLKK